MLPSEHAVVASVIALAGAPFVKDKKALAIFCLAAVGQDVDHYFWYVAHFRNPSLIAAYRYFRRDYGRKWAARGARHEARALHGPVPLLVAGLAAWLVPSLRPVFAGLLLHGLADAWNEYILMPGSNGRDLPLPPELRARVEQLTSSISA